MTTLGLIGTVRRAPMVAATLAADLGGSRLKAGLVIAGRVEQFEARATGGDGLATFLDAGSRLISVVGCARIGLAVPGIVEDGRVLALPGKFDGLAGTDLAGICENSLGLPASVINDAVAAGIGEARFGAGRTTRRVAVVSIGTGVGVCVLDGGDPVGSGPLSGGILGGQIPVVETSDHRDSSGGRSSIEAVCAAQRIVDYSGPGYVKVTDVYAGLRRGDVMARHGIERYRRMLVRALVALAHAHGPEMIVVRGGPMTRDNPILDGVEEDVNTRLFSGIRVRVCRAELGDRGPLLGVAAACR